MTSAEIARALERGLDTALLMTASLEQNGPHLSIDKHVVLGRAVAAGIARRHGGLLVAPIIPFGRADEHHGFAGTVGLSEPVFKSLVAEVIGELGRMGFRRVVVTGDHGTNRELLGRIAPELDRAQGGRGPRVLYAGDFYQRADERIDAELHAQGVVAPGIGPAEHSGHAGLIDTALLLAVAPDRARPPPWRRGPLALDKDQLARLQRDGVRAVSPHGVLGDPAGATAAIGRRALELLVEEGTAEVTRLVGLGR